MTKSRTAVAALAPSCSRCVGSRGGRAGGDGPWRRSRYFSELHKLWCAILGLNLISSLLEFAL